MLSIIIPTLNEENHIGSVLADLKPQLGEKDELIVVDGQSDDRTVEIAESYGVKVLVHPKSGNGAARTEGAKVAKNNIVVFIDADSKVPVGFTERIKKHFTDSDLVLVGGLDLYYADSKAWKFVYDSYSRIIFMMAKMNHAITRECWVPSNNSAFKKEVFLKAGGYRSVICEDSDLMRRLPRTKNIIYDDRLTVDLSDRRFRQNGFFRTVALWGWSNLKLIMGSKVGSEDYKKGY